MFMISTQNWNWGELNHLYTTPVRHDSKAGMPPHVREDPRCSIDTSEDAHNFLIFLTKVTPHDNATRILSHQNKYAFLREGNIGLALY